MKKKSITIVLVVFAVLSLCLSTFWLTAKNSSVQAAPNTQQAAPKTQQGPPPTQVTNCDGSVINMQDGTTKCIVEVLPKPTALSNAKTAYDSVTSQCKAMGMTIDEETVKEADAFYRGKLTKANSKYLTWYSEDSTALPRVIYSSVTTLSGGKVSDVKYGIITLGDNKGQAYTGTEVLNFLHFSDGNAISLSQIPVICSKGVPARPSVSQSQTLVKPQLLITPVGTGKPTILPNPVTKVVPAQRPVRPTQTAGDQ